MAKKQKNKLKKYPFGGYVEDWSETEAKLNQAKAEAGLAVLDDKLIQALQFLGPVTMQYGQQLTNQGLNLLQSGMTSQAAFGGLVGNNVEVEGGEVIETPDGTVGEVKGPSHEKGGVPMNLPDMTEIFSKRLKGNDGKTFAQRKKEREKQLKKLEKKLEKNPDDKLLIKTYERLKKEYEMLDKKDLAQMELFKQLFQQIPQEEGKMATGGTVGNPVNPFEDINNPMYWLNYWTKGLFPNYPSYSSVYGFNSGKGVTPVSNNLNMPKPEYKVPTSIDSLPEPILNTQQKGTDINNLSKYGKIGMDVAGKLVNNIPNIIGAYATYKQALNAEKTVLENQAKSKPNVNTFKNYGKETLKKIDEMKEFALRNKLLTERMLQDEANATRTSLRNSARGVEALRALDLAAQSNADKAKLKNELGYQSTLNEILGKEASTLMNIDRTVMNAEDIKNVRDKQDIDNYYTQLGKARAQKWEGLLKGVYLLNKQRNIENTNRTLNSMYDNYNYDASTGRITFKSEEEINTFDGWTNLPEELRPLIRDLALKGEVHYYVNQKAWIDKNGKIIYKFE